jgi:group II intron reverse transcriptase/maturase
VSLKPPESVRKLRETLHAKAKGNPGYRFYSLYDKVYRNDILHHAWQRCRANGGAAGVDGQSFEQIEAQGLERWLEGLTEELRIRTYRPQALRRVWIAKENGKQRPIGIPTIKDRVIQMATVLVIEPIFEADMPSEQYAYRSDRSALEAVDQAHWLLCQGYHQVVDADLSGYFDSIPHRELKKSLARRISDGAMLALIKMWLEMAVEETDERGRKRRTTESRRTGRGTPQGSPISPLLANIYMRRFVLGWKLLGWEQRLEARIVNFADDLVILCRGPGQEARKRMQERMERLRLCVNAEKTRVRRAPEEPFDFLGYTIGRCYKPQSGRAYIGTRPSRKRIRRVCLRIREMTGKQTRHLTAQQMVEKLNPVLRGWANYFRLGSVSKAYRIVDAHARHRLRQWLCGKCKQRGAGTRRYPEVYLHQTLGLLRLQALTTSLPWAKA